MKRFVVLWCLILFHSSDGSVLWIRSAAVTVVKPVPAQHQDHLARGTQAVIYTVTGKTFAVREADEDVVGAVDACDKGQP